MQLCQGPTHLELPLAPSSIGLPNALVVRPSSWQKLPLLLVRYPKPASPKVSPVMPFSSNWADPNLRIKRSAHFRRLLSDFPTAKVATIQQIEGSATWVSLSFVNNAYIGDATLKARQSASSVARCLLANCFLHASWELHRTPVRHEQSFCGASRAQYLVFNVMSASMILEEHRTQVCCKVRQLLQSIRRPRSMSHI